MANPYFILYIGTAISVLGSLSAAKAAKRQAALTKKKLQNHCKLKFRQLQGYKHNERIMENLETFI